MEAASLESCAGAVVTCQWDWMPYSSQEYVGQSTMITSSLPKLRSCAHCELCVKIKLTGSVCSYNLASLRGVNCTEGREL